MPTYVAFLRAVNIGRRQTPMARVRATLEASGFTDVQTYIQTGNVLLTTTARSPEKVGSGDLRTQFTHCIDIVPTILDVVGLPQPTEVDGIDQEPIDAATVVLNDWSAPGEWVRVVGRHVVLRLGIPANVVTLTNAKIERFGVVATTRDLTVVRALATRWGG